MLERILIANRGEIAVRVIRACREMGKTAIAVYSDVDRTSLHVRLADEAYELGPADPAESYLNIDRILEVARQARADAIHPGYGFLAENPAFARAVEAAGLVFIGPSGDCLEAVGDKLGARQLARVAGVPVVPGSAEPLEDEETACRVAKQLGYPVMLKAVAGGGGKGMRWIFNENELRSAWPMARGEAEHAFGDARLYLEKALDSPRHVEMQILADRYGHVVWLGERECSIQRRHQKVIEEAPSLILDPERRATMGAYAVAIAREAGYVGAGTVEFLVDASGNIYFLEVNARIQVEHPVTEMVTGMDLVKYQLAIAEGQPLDLEQDRIGLYGHAIECRIYAEDPYRNFYPSPGTIRALRMPSGPFTRVDAGVYAGWTVPFEYDPLLAKLIVWGRNREEAIRRMARALEEFQIHGIETTLALYRRIFQDPDYCQNRIDTRYLERFLERGFGPSRDRVETAVMAAAIAAFEQRRKAAAPAPTPAQSEDPWLMEARLAALGLATHGGCYE